MDVVCCLDDNYVMPCGILLLSICENNRDCEIVFHIVSEGLKESNKSKLNETVEMYNCKLQFYVINVDTLKKCPLQKQFQRKDLNLTTYYRLLLSSVLPIALDKVLYLDCDIIVCNSLKDLWDTDIENNSVGAIPDSVGDSILHYNRLDYDISLGYFNAGVLLINLKYWREHNLEKEFLDYIDSNNNVLENHDQDVLNYVLKTSKRLLPMRYNVMDNFLWRTRLIYIRKSYWKDMFLAAENPVIIHYICALKPWHRECTHPFKDRWKMYYEKSLWKNIPLIHKYSLKLRMGKWLRRILVKLNLLTDYTDCPYREEFL